MTATVIYVRDKSGRVHKLEFDEYVNYENQAKHEGRGTTGYYIDGVYHRGMVYYRHPHRWSDSMRFNRGFYVIAPITKTERKRIYGIFN